MKKYLMCVLTILASSIFTSYHGQTKLPKEMPQVFEITYIYEGSFVPMFYSVVISGSTIKVINQVKDSSLHEVRSEAKISDEDLENLYVIIRENNFDSIRPNQPVDVADGQQRSIELKFNRNRFYAVIGDGIKTTDRNGERFRNIENAIERLAKKYGKKEA